MKVVFLILFSLQAWAIGGMTRMKTGKFQMPYMVQTISGIFDAVDGVLTLPQNVKAGNTLVVCVTTSLDETYLQPTPLSTNRGDNFLALPQVKENSWEWSSMVCWWSKSAVGGSTTFTVTNPYTDYLILNVMEVAGVKGLDQIGLTWSDTSTAMSVATGGPTYFPWEYQIAIGTSLTALGPWTVDSGFRVRQQVANNTLQVSGIVADRIANNVENSFPAVGFTVAEDWSPWHAIILSFRPLNLKAPAYTWTGAAGDNLWSTPGNWNTNVVPGASDVAKFLDGECVGAACNVTLDTNVSVKGLHISAGYAGTLTRSGAITMNIGSSGYIQSGGAFAGGTGNLTITDGSFKFIGGTFALPAGDLKIVAATASGYEVFNAGSADRGRFTMGSGNLHLTLNSSGCVNGTRYTVRGNDSFATYMGGFRFAGGHPTTNNTCYWDVVGRFEATGGLTVGRDLANGSVGITSDWAVGDVYVSIAGNIAYNAGTNGGDFAYAIKGSATQTLTQVAGTTLPIGEIIFDKSGGSVVLGSNMTFSNSNFNVNRGVIEFGGYTLSGLNVFRIGSQGHTKQRNSVQWTSTSSLWASGCTFELVGTTTINLVWADSPCHLIANKTAPAYVNIAANSGFRGNVTVANGSQLRMGAFNLNVRGNFVNNLGGTFVPGTGTITLTGLAGSTQTIYGSNTFNNLIKSVTSNSTLSFEAGTTQTISGALTLTGSSATAKLNLRSATPGTQWSISAGGTRTLNYLDVQDSNNTHATPMAGTATSVNSGNNTNWTFP